MKSPLCLGFVDLFAFAPATAQSVGHQPSLPRARSSRARLRFSKKVAVEDPIHYIVRKPMQISDGMLGVRNQSGIEVSLTARRALVPHVSNAGCAE